MGGDLPKNEAPFLYLPNTARLDLPLTEALRLIGEAMA